MRDDCKNYARSLAASNRGVSARQRDMFVELEHLHQETSALRGPIEHRQSTPRDLFEIVLELGQHLNSFMLRSRSDWVDPKNVAAWLQFDRMPELFQQLAGFSPDRTASRGIFLHSVDDDERETAIPVMHLPGQPEHREIAVRSPQ